MIAEGDAFLLSLPDNLEIKHLYVVVSNPVLDPQHVVIVNLSTWEDGEDDACYLSAAQWGERVPFLKHDSYVRYRSARIVKVETIEEWLGRGIASEKEQVCPELLKEIRSGAEESQFLPNKCCLILNDQGLIEI